jgi:hypothetical protein
MSDNIFQIKIDDGPFKAIFKQYPAKARWACARLLNDMAFSLKKEAAAVIGKRMNVRNQGFVSRQLRVEKVKSTMSIDNMIATGGSVAIEPSSNHGGFSGWAEQEGEPSPAFMKKRPMRSIGKNARGGSMGALPQKKALLTSVAIIDMDDLLGPTMPSEASRAQAAIAIAAANQGKKGRVILREGSGFPPGLYGIAHVPKPGQYRKKIKNKGDKALPAKFIKVELLQAFEEDIDTKRIPWMEEAVEKVKADYSPQYIFDHYIAPILTAKPGK